MPLHSSRSAASSTTAAVASATVPAARAPSTAGMASATVPAAQAPSTAAGMASETVPAAQAPPTGGMASATVPAAQAPSTTDIATTAMVTKCSLCGLEVNCNDFTDHLSAYHAQITCEQCHLVLRGEVCVKQHLETVHHQPQSKSLSDSRPPTSLPSVSGQSSTSPSVSRVSSKSSSVACVSSTSPSVSPVSFTLPSVSSLSSTLLSVSRLSSTLPSVSCPPSPSLSVSHLPPTSASVSCLSSTSLSVSHLPSTSSSISHMSSMSTSVSQLPSTSLSGPPSTLCRPPFTSSTSGPLSNPCPPPTLSRPPSTSPSLSGQPPTLCCPPVTSTSVSGPLSKPSQPPTLSRPPSTSPSLSGPPSFMTEIKWNTFLPSQFTTVLHEGDWEWVAKTLYNSDGKLKDNFEGNWHEPPPPPEVSTDPPNPLCYFRKRLFIWAPRRLWNIPLICPECKIKLTHGGIYTIAREVIDLNWKYYMVGEYLRCSKCRQPQCPWRTELLDQLSPAQRLRFPAILTKKLALDKNVATLMKPRTMGNTSSYIQQAVDEIHSTEWAKRVVLYLSDCDLHKKNCVERGIPPPVYKHPPQYSSLPLASWFETAHAIEVTRNLTAMRGIITSVYGRVLKVDSTKKVSYLLISHNNLFFLGVVCNFLQFLHVYKTRFNTCTGMLCPMKPLLCS